MLWEIHSPKISSVRARALAFGGELLEQPPGRNGGPGKKSLSKAESLEFRNEEDSADRQVGANFEGRFHLFP
jgi:hypothetical protein